MCVICTALSCLCTLGGGGSAQYRYVRWEQSTTPLKFGIFNQQVVWQILARICKNQMFSFGYVRRQFWHIDAQTLLAVVFFAVNSHWKNTFGHNIKLCPKLVRSSWALEDPGFHPLLSRCAHASTQTANRRCRTDVSVRPLRCKKFCAQGADYWLKMTERKLQRDTTPKKVQDLDGSMIIW